MFARRNASSSVSTGVCGVGEGEGSCALELTETQSNTDSTARGITFGLARFAILFRSFRAEYTQASLNRRLIDLRKLMTRRSGISATLWHKRAAVAKARRSAISAMLWHKRDALP